MEIHVFDQGGGAARGHSAVLEHTFPRQSAAGLGLPLAEWALLPMYVRGHGVWPVGACSEGRVRA